MSKEGYIAISELYVPPSVQSSIAQSIIYKYPHTALKWGGALAGSKLGDLAGRRFAKKINDTRIKKALKKGNLKKAVMLKAKSAEVEDSGRKIGRLIGSAGGYGLGHAIIQSEKKSQRS